MPYITQEARDQLARPDEWEADTAGDLNYQITQLLVKYLKPHSERLNYKHINDVLGALEGAKLEFYRRVVVPYENTKLALNGDVYGA